MKREDDPDRDGRDETAAERADRNLMELLQELRVVALGVQVLFGFLLAIPFSTRYVVLDINQRHLYVATLVLAAVSIVLLIGPVAFHRAVFRLHEKTRLVTASATMTLFGLAAVGLSITSVVWLVLSVVCRGWAVPVISIATLLLFIALWGLAPVVARADRSRQSIR
jgi:cation transport ATPase